MIFVDTSALYALADSRDLSHGRATSLFRQSLAASEVLLVHNYVILEAAALIQNRIGLANSLLLLREAENFQIHWVTRDDHQLATALLESRSKRRLSLVDCASFVVMRQYQITEALRLRLGL